MANNKRKTPQEDRAGSERPSKRQAATTTTTPAASQSQPQRMTRSRFQALKADKTQEEADKIQLNPGLSMAPRSRKTPAARKTTKTPAAPKKKGEKKKKKTVAAAAAAATAATADPSTPCQQKQQQEVVDKCDSAPVAPVAYMGGLGEELPPQQEAATCSATSNNCQEGQCSSSATADAVTACYRYVDYPWEEEEEEEYGIPELLDTPSHADELLPVSFPTPLLLDDYVSLADTVVHRASNASSSSLSPLSSRPPRPTATAAAGTKEATGGRRSLPLLQESTTNKLVDPQRLLSLDGGVHKKIQWRWSSFPPQQRAETAKEILERADPGRLPPVEGGRSTGLFGKPVSTLFNKPVSFSSSLGPNSGGGDAPAAASTYGPFAPEHFMGDTAPLPPLFGVPRAQSQPGMDRHSWKAGAKKTTPLFDREPRAASDAGVGYGSRPGANISGEQGISGAQQQAMPDLTAAAAAFSAAVVSACAGAGNGSNTFTTVTNNMDIPGLGAFGGNSGLGNGFDQLFGRHSVFGNGPTTPGQTGQAGNGARPLFGGTRSVDDGNDARSPPCQTEQQADNKTEQTFGQQQPQKPQNVLGAAGKLQIASLTRPTIAFPPWPYGALSPIIDDDQFSVEIGDEDSLSY